MAEHSRIAMHISGERLDLVVASITDYAVFMLDPERHVVTWNAGAERILRYRVDEIVGQVTDVVFTPEDRQAGVQEQEQR
jgi:PAS domain-containing protein